MKVIDNKLDCLETEQCSCCLLVTSKLIEFDEIVDESSCSVFLCPECLRKAMFLVESLNIDH